MKDEVIAELAAASGGSAPSRLVLCKELKN
jgi:hypothetical protein